MLDKRVGIMGRLVFIIGGARSGKSIYAQQLAQKTSNKVAFIATAEALDGEMAQRIQSHQKTRPPGWITIEAPTRIRQKYIEANVFVDAVIIDCMTLLVSNLLMMATVDNCPDESYLNSLAKQEFDEIMVAIKESNALWIVVSNEVGSGIVPADSSSRVYRDMLGKVNQWMATEADEVFYMVAGIPIPIHQFRS